jgi:outer membrane autotransporter protein
MTNIWACPTGIAATGGPAGARFRNAFLGTVAAGALSLALNSPALAGPDACTLSGGGAIETCSGNQSAGISAPPTATTLNVNNLTTAITPANGTPGIVFVLSPSDVTLTSNTGAFGITTTGDGAVGIYALSGFGGAVTVTSTGNIATAGASASGIFAGSSGAVTVTSTGNITTTDDGAYGIFANSGGSVSVTSTGNITTAGINSGGIKAVNGATGAATVTSTGNITVAGDTGFGIHAGDGLGAATVTSNGNIAVTGNIVAGIFADSTGAGAVTVTSSGNIAVTGSTTAEGIVANSLTAGAVTVISAGNIAVEGNLSSGIVVNSASGDVTVISTGDIAAGGNTSFGILGNSASGAVTVTSTGNITAGTTGIYATGGNGAATVTSKGNITAGITGLEVLSGNDATVTSIGNIIAGVVGIEVYSGTGAVTVTSIGNITTKGVGIAAAGPSAATVTSTGNITADVGIYGASSGGPIAITIKSGTVSGGSLATLLGPAAAVILAGGTDNTLTNMGTLMSLSGFAIVGVTGLGGQIGNNTVNNSGTVIGNVVLGSGTNAFNNQAGGLFDAGATVDLGAGNLLTNAGTLSPGGAGAIQTTALTGNLVQNATGRLLTDINIAGATSDRVNVSGTAALAGAVQVQIQNAMMGPWQQTVLSATGGTTNNGLSLLASPALQAQLVFPNATDVAIKSAGINFVVPGLGVNQTALGNALNGALQSGGAGGPIFNALLNGPTSLAGFSSVLSQLSGEAATGTQQTTFDAMNLFMGTMLDPFNRSTTPTPGNGVSGYASEGDASAYAADGRKRTAAERDARAMFTKAPPQNFEARWNVWAAGFGGSQTTDGNAAIGSNGATSRIAGTVVGADYYFSPNTIAGFALAGGGTSYTVGNGLGSGRSDMFQAGVYARHTMGAAYIAGALAYGWQDITTNRTVTLAGLDQLQARFNANAFSGRVEGGYRFVTPWIGGIGLTPYAAAQFTTFDLPAYAEQAVIGTNNFALAYGAKSVTDPRSEVGFRTDKSYAMPDGVLTLRSRFAWAHDYDPSRSIGATFQALPGASFVVNGAAQASDSALTTASVEMKWRNNWSVAATFEGEFSSVTSSYAGKGVVRYAW